MSNEALLERWLSEGDDFQTSLSELGYDRSKGWFLGTVTA